MGEAWLKRAGQTRLISGNRERSVQCPTKRVARVTGRVKDAGSISLDRAEDVTIAAVKATDHVIRSVLRRSPSRLQKATVSGMFALAGFISVANASAAQGQSRFASYASEAECLGSHTLSASTCRSAFANARQEYETKTPSFPSQTLCRRRFASCMAWPPDASSNRPTAFRPEWDGVDIVDTPTEQTVTPAPGSTGRSIRFAARPLNTEPQHDLVIQGAAPGLRSAPGLATRPGRPIVSAPPIQHAAGSTSPERELPPSAPPLPGSGFKLEDGVLTYPAPERFQPKNLPKLN